MAGGCRSRNAERHIVRYDRDLGLQIRCHAPAYERRSVAKGAPKRIRATLIHERVGAKRKRAFQRRAPSSRARRGAGKALPSSH